jgi:hypothetical protein
VVCVANPGGNYVDLIGNQGFGAIQSTPISLIAGDTYAISYTAILQGFDTGSTPTEAYNVNVFTELINPTVVPVSISFVAGSSQADAVLSFISGDNIDGVHGPVLSDITVDQFGTSPAPGPIPSAGLLSYLALGLLRPWVGWVGGSDKGRRKADNAKPADVRFDGRKSPQEGSASDITANAVATIFHNMPGVEGDEEINPFRVHAPRPALSWSFPALEDVYVGRRNAIH